MRFIQTLFLFISATTVAFSQDSFDPKVAVLFPNRVIASNDILSELSIYEQKVEITEEFRGQYVSSELTENWKFIRRKGLDFIQDQSLASNFTFIASSCLLYEVYEYEENPLIFPSLEKCSGSKEALKKMATKLEVDWVVNIRELKLTNEREKNLSARIQLYNLKSDRVYIDKEYVGGTTNPGGSFECIDGSWDCATRNAIKSSVGDLFDILDKYRINW